MVIDGAPAIHAGTSTGRRQFRTGHAPEIHSTAAEREAALLEQAGRMAPFRAPAPGSPWNQVIFRPTYDPFDVVTSAFVVKAKNSQILPFVPFETQRRFNQNLGLRNITVKPRQVGMSTITLGLMTANAITCPNLGTLILTHRDDTTLTMRETVKRFITELVASSPNLWKLDFGVDNADMLQILPYDSWFFFGTAGGSKDSGVGRSRTVQMFLGSELAHWQTPDPGKVLGGITESIPDTGVIFLESTPNGAVGPFYNIFTDKRNSYVKHFYPWFIEPSRKLNLRPGTRLTLTEDEQMLVATHGLTHEQIAWRRWKSGNLKSEGLDFAQEYPEDEISCFTAGVRSAMPTRKLATLLKQAEATPYTEETVGWEGDDHDPGGTLKVWEAPRTDRRYLVSGDVGGGHRDGDESVSHVIDLQSMHCVAVLAGRWLPEKFGELGVLLARRYNNAYLAHEANGLGVGAVNGAYYKLKYDNYHIEQRTTGTSANNEAKVLGEEWKPGFYVTQNSRTPLLRLIIQAAVDNQFYCWDAETIRQATAMRIERGRQAGGWADKIEVPRDIHDDRIMSYAQALALARLLVVDEQGQGQMAGRARPRQGL